MDYTLLLIDGSSFVFRAYHAMPNLTSPTGATTGATYGMINMIKQLQKKYPTAHWGCVFDTKGETFRDRLHAEYKAHRIATPQDLLDQLPDIYTIIEALGIPVIMQNGIEADDIIGTLAIQAKKAKHKVLIATGDKDFAQLVDDNITLINTMNNEVLDYAGVVNKFGVKPEQIIDYLALVGDKVDNIPGVDKCGPKTAAKWLQQYGNLENIIANREQLTGVVGENLRQAVNWLATAKTLVTIVSDLDLSHILPHGPDSLICKPANEKVLRECYTKLGFRTWLRQLNAPEDAIVATSTPLVPLAISSKPQVIITTPQQLTKLIHSITSAKETIALLAIADDYQEPQFLRFIVISTPTTIYIINNNLAEDNDLFSSKAIPISYSQPLIQLFSSQIAKVIPNYKETLQLFTKLNLPLNNVVGDITLAHYIKDSKQNHSLSTIYKEYLNLEIIDLPTLNSKINKNSLWLSKDMAAIIANCSSIVGQALSLEQQIRQCLDPAELKLYQEVELPLAQILVKIETNGIKLDIAQFKILEQELSSRLFELENKIYAQAQCVFNINSSKQLQDVLFNQLKLPTLGIKTNTTGHSTDEDSLKLLEDQGIAIATELLEYRTLSKLLNTYVAKLPKLIDSQDKVHTTFEQALVASGRLSSKEPNLQNIPVRNEWGRRIRQCFIADPEHVLVCADYSQIELRILAHLSADENLIHAFNTNQDIHSATASEIFHKPIDQVTKDERRYAKIINFSLLYGKTVFGLAQELKIDRATAKVYIDTYFAKYPKIKHCLDNIKETARSYGFVSTIFGRRIYLPNINTSNKVVREAEERLALNAPMQGTSADIIKIAMLNIDKWLTTHKLKSQIILQVHDELILQVPLNEVTLITANLARLMTEEIKLAVKLAVDVKTAANWDEAH